MSLFWQRKKEKEEEEEEVKKRRGGGWRNGRGEWGVCKDRTSMICFAGCFTGPAFKFGNRDVTAVLPLY